MPGNFSQYKHETGLEQKISRYNNPKDVERDFNGAILYGDNVVSDADFHDAMGAQSARSLYNLVKESEVGRAIASKLGGDDEVVGYACIDLGKSVAGVVEINGEKYLAVNKKYIHVFGNIAKKIDSLDDVPIEKRSEYVHGVRTMAHEYVRALGVEDESEAWETLKEVYGNLKKKARKEGDEKKADVYAELERDAEDHY